MAPMFIRQHGCLFIGSPIMSPAYPKNRADRDRWIAQKRGAKRPRKPDAAYGAVMEMERSAEGFLVESPTLFLTNRECPWKCVMCDLWEDTLDAPLPPGFIPKQIEDAISKLYPQNSMPSAKAQIKLYNNGSFFDGKAIPPQDHPSIIQLVNGFDRVIVESHPRLVNENVVRFRDQLNGRLEVAMGLETAHPEALERINKGINPGLFKRKARYLKDHNIDLRIFLLVHPPFIPRREQMDWLKRSIEFSMDCHASVVSLILTRSRTGAMEALERSGDFEKASLADLEEGLAFGIQLKAARVFADLWDLDAFQSCTACHEDRKNRLDKMNRGQVMIRPVMCNRCGNGLQSAV